MADSGPDPDFDRILVGVDGSEGSDRALRWARTMARITGAEVLAVHGFEYVLMRGAETNDVLLEQTSGELEAAGPMCSARTVSRTAPSSRSRIPGLCWIGSRSSRERT